MKKNLALLLVSVFLLTGGAGITSADKFLPENIPAIDAVSGETLKKIANQDKASEIKVANAADKQPDRNLTKKETVSEFFERQYDGYLSLKYIGVSNIVSTDKKTNKNMIKWLKMMMMRRRLIKENDLGYVETERFAYKIVFDDEPNDNRMQLWHDHIKKSNETVVHFHIAGEKGKAYPPFMALNSQHSMFLKKVDGVWKIQMHYFPGSARKFTSIGTIKAPTEEQMLRQLKKEFAEQKSPKTPEAIESANAKEYDSQKAVRYAKKYTEQINGNFPRLGDWTGDCANFVSQCVWAGFGGGDSMTAQWRIGTAPWVHVNSFWNCIISGHELKGQQINGIKALAPGDIIQTRTSSGNKETERFTHTLILVDDEKLIMAQNTPSAFLYYSDLSNTEVRFVRPTYLLQ